MGSYNVGKNAAFLTVSKIITILISLISAMLLSRFRTLEEYGTYSQILIVINLSTALFLLGLPNSTNYFLAISDTQQERQRFLSVYFSMNTVLSFIMGGVLTACVPIIVAYFDNPLINSFSYIFLLLPWTKVIIGSISNVLVVYGRTDKLTIFNIVNAVVALAAVLLTKIFGWSFREYMMLYLGGEVIMMLCVYAIVWNLEKPLHFSLDKHLVCKVLQYSIPIGIASLVGTVSVEIDKLMIGWFFNTEQLAIYSNAAKELPFTIVASSLTAVLLPKMARMLKEKDTKNAVVLWGNSILLSYIFICFCVTALIVFAPQVMTILYSEKYLPGVSVFRVYSLVLLLRCTYFGLILNSIGKTKFIFYSSIASLVLNAVLNYIGYLLFGMVGPSIATLMSILCVNFVQLLFSAKKIDVAFVEIFPWKKLLYISLINAVWGILIFYIVKVFDLGTSINDIVISVGIGILVMGCYVIIMFRPCKRLWRFLNNQ